MSNKITNMTLSVKAIGGNLSFPTFSSPQGLTQVNIDLSSWMSSMASADSYRMIDIESEGLMPLSKFVLEKNIDNILVNIFMDDLLNSQWKYKSLILKYYVGIYKELQC